MTSIFRMVTALFLSSALLAPAQQSTTTLRIRILNARTNQPIADERLNVALAADQISSVAMPTDKTGTILVTPGAHTTLRILANMYADCRPRAELYTDYPIATILRTGITTGNLCSSATQPRRRARSSSTRSPRPSSAPSPTPPTPRSPTPTRTQMGLHPHANPLYLF